MSIYSDSASPASSATLYQDEFAVKSHKDAYRDGRCWPIVTTGQYFGVSKPEYVLQDIQPSTKLSNTSKPNTSTGSDPIASNTIVTPLWAVGKPRCHEYKYHDTARRGEGSPPPPNTLNSNVGGVPASPHHSWSAYGDTAVTIAVKMVQRIEDPNDVDNAVPIIRSWLNGLPKKQRDEAVDRIRKASTDLFGGLWHPKCERKFLTYAEYDALVVKKEFPATTPGQVKRLKATKHGLATAMLLGKLLQANIIHNGDVALAAELLFDNRKRHCYMRALHELVYQAGDKICRRASAQRILRLRAGLERAIDEIGSFEIKFFAYPIISLISYFMRVQDVKKLITQPKNFTMKENV